MSLSARRKHTESYGSYSNTVVDLGGFKVSMETPFEK